MAEACPRQRVATADILTCTGLAWLGRWPRRGWAVRLGGEAAAAVAVAVAVRTTHIDDETTTAVAWLVVMAAAASSLSEASIWIRDDAGMGEASAAAPLAVGRWWRSGGLAPKALDTLAHTA